jgi:hypothetical protein
VAIELAQIQRYDPSIKSIKDLLKQTWTQEFKDLVQKGSTFLEAYTALNRDKVEAAGVAEAAAAARQQTVNAIRSKDHLRSTAPRGSGSISVPGDVMAMYKSMMPDATEEEIKKHYNKSKKK